MTTDPETFTVSESAEPIDNSATDDYGPDSSQTTENDAKSEARERINKAKQSPKSRSKLGQNKKRNSGIRQLTEKDREKIADLYRTCAFMAMPFKQDMAKAVVDNADDCAQAWFELAKENDGIRRVLLGMIEGGAWTKLAAAHMPILIAAIPADSLPLPLQAAFGNAEPPDDASGLYGTANG